MASPRRQGTRAAPDHRPVRGWTGADGGCVHAAGKDEQLVLGLLDREERAALERHLTVCPHCRRRFAALSAITDALQSPAADDASERNRILRLQACLAREVDRARERTARRRRPVVLFRVAALFAAVAGTAAWLAPRGTVSDRGPLVESRWAYSSGVSWRGTPASPPLVCDRTVVLVEEKRAGKRLVGLDRDVGEVLWRGSWALASASVAVADGRLFVWRAAAGGGATLAALDPETGRLLWDGPGNSSSSAAELAAVGAQVCWTAGASLYAVDTDGGHATWTVHTGLVEPLSRPAAAGDLILAAGNGGVCAVRAGDGSVAWRTAFEAYPGRPAVPLLVAAGRHILVAQRHASGAGRLVCLDRRRGAVVWGREIPDPILSVAAGEHVYVRAGGIRSFSLNEGTPLWALSLSGCSPVAAEGHRLYAVEGSGRPWMVAIDAANGRLRRQHPLAVSCNGIVVRGRWGYLTTRDGALQAVRLGEGGEAS
ncbi:MAG: PQQ-binding-like beta-propeller repeat protein [Lentisphaeria bacterium]|nr:PQQ-binding-like beta-propeller repeat protein [Lentisphaeria bacterium]